MQPTLQDRIFEKVDKQFVANLPLFAFTGRIVVVQSESEAVRAVAALRKSPILGIDTETRPAFRRGVSHKVALLQISNHEICFLFRLNYIGLPDCLIDLLSDPSIKKVGLSLKDDFLMLGRRKKFTPQGCIDLQHKVGEVGIKDMSLQKLFANIFRMKISKGAQLSNWEADVLTESQKRYAATDAYTCILMYEALLQYQGGKEYTLIRTADAESDAE